jgi:hypothetical protein
LKKTRQAFDALPKRESKAVWMFADGKQSDIIMETGVYNLTKDRTEALVHFGKEKTRTWIMVRMKEPETDNVGPKSS